VQLLLFGLGRELSLKKLQSVWSVALLGGSLQIVALMVLGGLVAAVVKSSVSQVGAGNDGQACIAASVCSALWL
jgi:predicted Kef-type K+ transport protein